MINQLASVSLTALAAPSLASPNARNQPEFDQAKLTQLQALFQPVASIANELDAKMKLEVEDRAKDFESIFLSLMIKEMRSSMTTEGEGLFAGENSDTMGGMFDMFMGKHLADAQPLGLFNALESYVKRSSLPNRIPVPPDISTMELPSTI